MALKAPPSMHDDSLFLPDFCSMRMVFAVVVMAELLAFILLLMVPPHEPVRWEDLGMLSLFIQWIALASTALLCGLRKWMIGINNTLAGYISYALVLVVTLLVSEAAYWSAIQMGIQRDGSWHQAFLLRNLGISAILSAVILRLIYLQHQQRMHIQAHADARIQALQARIRPHFLFNSMNTIAALIRSQPDDAEAAVEDLSDLFRTSLRESRHLVTLAEEIETAKRYLHIESLRLGSRLQHDWQLDNVNQKALLPMLTLQPLLENAIYHGIETMPEGGTIRIHAQQDNGLINLSIYNPCPLREQGDSHRGNRMAQENIRERMLIAFGTRAHLEMKLTNGECCVELVFPIQAEQA